MNRRHIIDAYIFLRENNNTIPDNVLDFIKDVSLSAYDSLGDEYCTKCEHNGSQMIYPSPCTGCGGFGEKRHFRLKATT